MALSRTTRVNLLIGSAHMLSHFYMLCLPPMFLAWQRSFDVSYAQLGMSMALMSGTTALLQTPVGFMVDRHGARRFLIGGTLLMSLSMTAMGFTTAYWQILVLCVLSGIGNSVIHPADYAILTGSVDQDRMGRSFAFHTFNGNLGFMAAPPVTAALTGLMGWRWCLISLGLLGVPAVLGIVLQSRILHDQVRPHAAHAGPVLSGRELLMTRPMLLFFAFFMLSAMANAGLQSWLITVMHAVHGMHLEVASIVLTAYMTGNTGGVLIGGHVADRLKQHIMTFAVTLTVLSAGLMLLADAVTMPALLTIAVMLAAGIGLGASRTPRDVMVKDAAPPGQIGKVFGFISSGLPLGQAITPVPFGFLIDRGHPELVLVLAAIILLASLLCAGTARSAARTEAVAVSAG
jgi:MFS family permease